MPGPGEKEGNVVPPCQIRPRGPPPPPPKEWERFASREKIKIPLDGAGPKGSRVFFFVFFLVFLFFFFVFCFFFFFFLFFFSNLPPETKINS